MASATGRNACSRLHCTLTLHSAGWLVPVTCLLAPRGYQPGAFLEVEWPEPLKLKTMSNMTQAQIFAEQKRVDKERKRDRSGLRALDDERATGGAPEAPAGYVRAAAASGGEASSITVDVGGREVALFKLPSGGHAACDATCPHQGGRLELGAIEECDTSVSILCPRHAWAFDLKSGFCDILCDYGIQIYDTLVTEDGTVRLAPQPFSTLLRRAHHYSAPSTQRRGVTELCRCAFRGSQDPREL